MKFSEMHNTLDNMYIYHTCIKTEPAISQD